MVETEEEARHVGGGDRDPAERAYLRDGSGPFRDFLASRGSDAADWAARIADACGVDRVELRLRNAMGTGDTLLMQYEVNETETQQ